ncbi:SHOCT domain-containing protein [Chloroflexota bacterium]
MWFMHDVGSWWWLFGGVWMFVFWGGLIALIVWGITSLTRRNNLTLKHIPLDVAKERYARGEVNREQFEQIKRDLF